MQRQYTVEGFYPFPTDMLRYDHARAATAADQALIDRLSTATETDDLDCKVRINLVMDSGEPLLTGGDIPKPFYPMGPFRPTEDRWQSFGWKVSSVSE